MDIKFETLRKFLEEITNIGIWQRIFGWRHIRKLSYDAYAEFQKLVDSFDGIGKEVDEFKSSIGLLQKDKEHLEKKTNDQEKDLVLLRERTDKQASEISRLGHDNTAFKQNEDSRKRKYENDVAALNAIREQIQKERQEERDNQVKKEAERFELMKKTWAEHQDRVKNVIKMICERRTIDYVDKVPFKGNPDNTIKICDEFVIFDAKCPSSDDLNNFPKYIKEQTESVKKYVKEENVRKEIFLVIPSNTVDVIKQFSYNMGDYNVWVVTLDALEPIMLSLKKIEDYEFVDQLTPEERENICRIISKFVHITKRKIQIDHFFTKEFIEALIKCETSLPEEMLQKVVELEKSAPINPPQERREKQILTKDLESDNKKIEKSLKSLPLYEDEEIVQ